VQSEHIRWLDQLRRVCSQGAWDVIAALPVESGRRGEWLQTLLRRPRRRPPLNSRKLCTLPSATFPTFTTGASDAAATVAAAALITLTLITTAITTTSLTAPAFAAACAAATCAAATAS